MRTSVRVAALAAVLAITGGAADIVLAAPAQARCGRAVVFTLPGVTWADVARWSPPNLLAAVEDGAAGSMSVRTVASRTSYASGFASIGAGNRVDGTRTTGGVASRGTIVKGADLPVAVRERVRAAGLEEMLVLAEEAAYGAVPGSLASTLPSVETVAIGNADVGKPPPLPVGFGRWSLLASMDERGEVDLGIAAPDLLKVSADARLEVVTRPGAIRAAVRWALARTPCQLAVIDHGDLERVEAVEVLQRQPVDDLRAAALGEADALLGVVRSQLAPSDLLIVVSPTSPAWDDDVHFGIAVAVGKSFPAGSSLESASTRRRGIVTLADVAPSILEFFDTARPAEMAGRPFFGVATGAPDTRLAEAIALDEEAVFIDRLRTPVVTGFVVFQIVAYLLTLGFLSRRERRGRVEDRVPPVAQVPALALAAFPVSTYLTGALPQHELGTTAFVGLLLAVDAALVGAVWVAAKLPLDRLLALTALTTMVLIVDLITGSRLQVNTVFSYSPLVAGRFAGIGNIAFSVLAATAIITGALLVHRHRGAPKALAAVAALFVIVIVVDGAPQFGSDVGGVLALVPGLGMTWLLLSGKTLNWRWILAGSLAAVVVLGLFLAVDLSRPPESRSHLGRLLEDVREGGSSVLLNTIERKVRTNLRVFRSTIWTYLVPPLVAAMAWLLFRPRGRWQRLATTYPRLRGGLVGALVLAILGFAVNDSGIVVPAVILSFLVPMALVMHLSLELSEA